MARVAFPYVLQALSGAAISGGSATITNHVAGSTPGSGSAATIYTSETGGGTVAGNALTTDATGRWTQGGPGFAQYWLAPGTYDIAISGTGLTSYVITREFIPSSATVNFSQDLTANRPAAAAVNAGATFYATDGQTYQFSTGSAWVGVALTSAPSAFTSTVSVAGLLSAQADLTLDAGSGTRAQTITLTGRNAGTATSSTLAVSTTGGLTFTSGTSSVVGATSGGTAFTATTTTFNIPSGAAYQINGTQISASNLSNGVTGTGAVALAASPTFTGTLTAAIIAATTLSGTPNFSGAATGQTAAVDTNTTQLATTAFVLAQASAAGDGTPAMDGTAARGTATHFARADHVHPTDTSRSPLASPTFTGTVTIATAAVTTFSGTPNFSGAATGTTATAGDSTTKLATTAFVATSFAPLASPTFTGTTTIATAAVTTFSGTPNFTGNATAVTQAANDNSTRLATTAYADRTGGTSARMTADILSTTSMQNATALLFSIGANENWSFEFVIYVAGAGSGTAFNVQLTGPASPTNVLIATVAQVGGSTVGLNSATGFSSAMAATVDGTNGNISVIRITGTIENGANAGTVQAQFSSTATAKPTVKRGSSSRAWKET